jgi:hypothetical protein
MSDLPKIINAQITVTYNLDDLRNNLAELNGVQDAEIKDHEVTAALYGLLGDDFGALSDSVYLLDENGEQVQL